jgi:predicted nucleic acid-binding Zn ribbon protein
MHEEAVCRRRHVAPSPDHANFHALKAALHAERVRRELSPPADKDGLHE